MHISDNYVVHISTFGWILDFLVVQTVTNILKFSVQTVGMHDDMKAHKLQPKHFLNPFFVAATKYQGGDARWGRYADGHKSNGGGPRLYAHECAGRFLEGGDMLRGWPCKVFSLKIAYNRCFQSLQDVRTNDIMTTVSWYNTKYVTVIYYYRFKAKSTPFLQWLGGIVSWRMPRLHSSQWAHQIKHCKLFAEYKPEKPAGRMGRSGKESGMERDDRMETELPDNLAASL